MHFNPDPWNRSLWRTGWRSLTLMLVLCSLGFVIWRFTPSAGAQDQPTATPAAEATSMVYVVRAGDSWIELARRFGVTVRELQNANPQAIRVNLWLRTGERLTIPGVVAPADEAPAPAAAETVTATVTITGTSPATVTVTTAITATGAVTTTATLTASNTVTPEVRVHVVQTGEGWSIIAAQYGVTMRELMAANPRSVRASTILHRGETLVIPQPGVPVTPTPTPSDTATPPPTETATATPTAAEATSTATPGASPETAEEPSAQAAGAVDGCPTDFVDYPDRLFVIVNGPDGGADALTSFLTTCNAFVEGGVTSGDWTGDGADDLLVVYMNPSTETATPQTDLIIYNSGATGLIQGFRARAAGTVTLLATADLNSDDQADVAWADRNCGASTCFDTVEVISWDGSQWRDWTDGSITMAYSEIQLQESTPDGQGQEISLTGGIYGSVGAGPQRTRSEVWASVGGAPYTLHERIYEASNCLYHTVIDANEALLQGTPEGFDRAGELYTKAATDDSLEQCWSRENELDELRSFSLFRLALTAAYQGNPSVAADLIDSLDASYADSIYSQVGQVWLDSYQESSDIGTACSAANQFATQNPLAWEILADYGYANPSFEAADLCPVLDIEGLTTGAPVTATLATTQTSVLSPGDTQLPVCPASLSGYPEALPQVLSVAAGDPLITETWLRQCDAMSDDRGGYALLDANRDGLEDALFWPTVVSDLGFGPDGAQGDLLLFHGAADGVYTLAVDEEIYGQPTLLAAEDINGDGNIDLSWQVVGCSTTCVLEVQIISWDGEAYVPIIQPGAIIAEGEAQFEPIATGEPGQGMQLTLTGGVSGSAEGGLAVPHTEIWQSVQGGAFQRISWTYDRTVEGNDCLGLRLVEADVALQASPVLGYQAAVELYGQSIDPALAACSIHGMPAEDELILLQGLAAFRLVQAQALAGNLEDARADLAGLTLGQPDSHYTQAATQWLETFEQGQDAAAACQAVLPIFNDNPTLWQITDQFGYNHPALAAEQICYIPG
jgi:LysM repeat protein